jgi:hypothetical protein
VASALFSDGVEAKFTSVTDIRVVSSSSECTKILGEIQSSEDTQRAKPTGEEQLGAHMILSLASSDAPSSILGVLASPAEVKIL